MVASLRRGGVNHVKEVHFLLVQVRIVFEALITALLLLLALHFLNTFFDA